MGIVCGFYRVNNEVVDFLKSNPENAQTYIDENYSWITGKYHIEGDTAFETDKAWDIAKFLLKKCDPSPERVLQELDGIKITPSGDWDSPRYINSKSVKEIRRVLETIQPVQVMKAYNQTELVDNKVYRADWFDVPDWDYIFSHIETMKKAFAKAAECGDCIVINFS